jgi:hypothetical protein
MSDDNFKEARGSLAFSQSLRDRMTAEKMAQQSQMMPQEQMPEQEPEEPENNPQPEEKEEPEESKIVQMFQTFMKEMRGFFQKDLQEDKKTEEKVDQLLAEEKKDEVKM